MEADRTCPFTFGRTNGLCRPDCALRVFDGDDSICAFASIAASLADADKMELTRTVALEPMLSNIDDTLLADLDISIEMKNELHKRGIGSIRMMMSTDPAIIISTFSRSGMDTLCRALNRAGYPDYADTLRSELP